MDTLQLWSQIGNYRILAPIAHGGFGSTYKGQHTTLLNRIVAIKLVQNTFLTTQKDRDRLLYEAYLLEHLRHPYIVALIDAGIHEGRPYLVMEYMSHGTLQDCLDRHGTRPLSQEKTMEILTRIGQALTYAHHMGIVHRDLKPANILFNIKNEAFLADFGIATILNNATMRKTTTILGSLRFMAPEQFKGIISKEGDQYALACIAYQLFTGHAPFEMSDPAALIYHHLNEYPLTPRHFNIQLPSHIERALFKGMAKQRSERYPSIAEFLMALQPASSYSRRSKEDWLDEGYIHFEAKQYESALIAYNHALKLDPFDAIVYINKGIIFYNIGHYEAALEAFNHALLLDPSNKDAAQGKKLTLQQLQK